jgi:NitT/TauT family transport system substrate-binding protein
VFAVSDQVDMVANGLLTSDKMIQENPVLIKGMIRALLKGIADTIKDPAEAMQITTKYVEGLKADDPIQQKVLAATIEVMKSEKYGESKASAWETTQNTLLAMGQITEKMDVNSFYTNEFLP